ncbi:MAG: YaaC [Bacillales bacterium]|nr:YaaC [Bacillales bacterium]
MHNVLDYENFSVFFSSKFTTSFLQKNYENLNVQNPKILAYENCYSFISYLEHGIIYFRQAEISPIQIKPLLLFYGLLHLMKACVLKVDPFYPENSAVLSHGVSTRKRKKSGYEFLKDEIKIQKNGFFSHAANQLYQIQISPFEKYSMLQLLDQVKDLSSTFKLLSIHLNKKVILPELLTHYLLLYNLSMIVRYESEWWSDLLKNFSHFDFIFINQFLNISLKETQSLVLKFLLEF